MILFSQVQKAGYTQTQSLTISLLDIHNFAHMYNTIAYIIYNYNNMIQQMVICFVSSSYTPDNVTVLQTYILQTCVTTNCRLHK